MKPHPRIRKTIKWGGAVVTVLLAVLWMWSGWYRIAWQSKSPTGWGIGAGEFRLCVADAAARKRPSPSTPGWSFWRYKPDWRLYWFQHESFSVGAGSVDIYVVPLWLLVITCGFATAAAWWLDALAHIRARLGLCPKCSYNRAGLSAGAKCPECGAMPT